MQIITSNGPRGTVVSWNTAQLAATFSKSATIMTINYDVFSNGDTVTCGEEDITIGTAGTSCTSCTRGVNDTTDATHLAGMNVRLASGTEILTYTFGGTEYLSAIRCGGDHEALFGIEINSTIEYIASTSQYQAEAIFPMTRYEVTEDDVIAVLVWSPAQEAVFWAEYQS